jgi:hypothetical protein
MIKTTALRHVSSESIDRRFVLTAEKMFHLPQGKACMQLTAGYHSGSFPDEETSCGKPQSHPW